MQLLHCRMGHSGIDAMRKLLMGKLVRGIDSIKIEDLQPCDFCKQGKLPQGHHPVADIVNKGTRLLDLVVVDLAGRIDRKPSGGSCTTWLSSTPSPNAFFSFYLPRRAMPPRS